MNYRERLSPIKVLILGAVNGLMVGLALEKARLTYVNYQMTQAAREYAQNMLKAMPIRQEKRLAPELLRNDAGHVRSWS